ncbi:MAG: hypothetical protein Q9160_009350 [Pyrenula sp. 1 TL-2023]
MSPSETANDNASDSDYSNSTISTDGLTISTASIDGRGVTSPVLPNVNTDEDEESESNLLDYGLTLGVDLPGGRARRVLAYQVFATLNSHPRYQRCEQRLSENVLQEFFAEHVNPTLTNLIRVLKEENMPQLPFEEMIGLWTFIASLIKEDEFTGNDSNQKRASGNLAENAIYIDDQALSNLTGSDHTSPEPDLSDSSSKFVATNQNSKRKRLGLSSDPCARGATSWQRSSKRPKRDSAGKSERPIVTDLELPSSRQPQSSDRKSTDQEACASSSGIQQLEVRTSVSFRDGDKVLRVGSMGDAMKISVSCKTCQSAANVVFGETTGV